MNKQEYMKQLKEKLRRLPKEEFAYAVSYFEEYFEEAGAEHEEEAAADLGSPQEAADQIIRDMAFKLSGEPVKDVRKGMHAFWVGLLALCAAPIALPLVFAGVTIALCGMIVLWAFLFAALICTGSVVFMGPITIIAGFTVLTKSIPVFLTCLGMGAFCIGAGALLTYGLYHLCRHFMGWTLKIFAGIIKRGGKK